MREDRTRELDVLEMDGVRGHLHINIRANFSRVFFSSIHIGRSGKWSSLLMDTNV